MYSMDTDPNMYVIPLDAIDLNYMSASLYCGNGKVMPLWAKSNLDRRNDEYFEFKIEHSDSEDELNTEMGNTLCHICDIDVPTSFMKEHYESFKHKINVKIINTALDRIRRSIDNGTIDEKKCSKLHFCPVCVAVVNKEEKVSHEKSISHKNSVIVEKFLYDFYLLYANECNESKLNGAEILEEREMDFKNREDEVEPKVNELEEIIEKQITNNNYLPAYTTNGNLIVSATQKFNDVVKSVDKVIKVNKLEEVVEKNMTNNNYLLAYTTNENIIVTATQESNDVAKSVDIVTKVNKLEEVVEKNMTNNNYLPAYTANENIIVTATQESNDVAKSVDKVTKAKIKKKKEAKITESKSDLIKKENENPSKVKPTQSSDTTTAPTKKKKKKAKLDKVENHKHEAAISSGIEEVLPDAEYLNSFVERTIWDVNSKSDVSVFSDHYEYIKYIHHLQETLFNLYCKVCNLNINDIKDKISHLEGVFHYENYLKFLVDNMMLETNGEAKVECVACGEILNRKDEVEHCMTIKHITNLEIHNKLNAN